VILYATASERRDADRGYRNQESTTKGEKGRRRTGILDSLMLIERTQ